MLFKLFWGGLGESWRTFFLGPLSKLQFIFGEVLSLTHENFEEQIRSNNLPIAINYYIF